MGLCRHHIYIASGEFYMRLYRAIMTNHLVNIYAVTEDCRRSACSSAICLCDVHCARDCSGSTGTPGLDDILYLVNIIITIIINIIRLIVVTGHLSIAVNR